MRALVTTFPLYRNTSTLGEGKKNPLSKLLAISWSYLR